MSKVLEARIAELEAQLADRDEIIAQLRGDPIEVWERNLLQRFHMGLWQAKLLLAIYRRNYVNLETIGHLITRGEPDNVLKVQVCRLRKKLAPYGIAIKTIWGVGYKMEPDSKEKLRRLANVTSTDS